ncbi:MAG: DNA repair protein RecO [Bacillati bacterium ANGP1]|uniref:DNA repair protein RecO n=1 Tax=Candidatus Segetimicrobium genomatis TaxID=2569760 RepID=A0A537IZZ2_9BACT|nr:MAG: DNA repair protein RecO [Terrabacteria group bacterium ANGP1]
MPVYKAEGIVIRRGNLGEADRLVTLLCRDQGKVTAAAKGARKPKSRFAGRLELFSHVRVLLAVGRTLDVVSQVEVAAAFAALRENLDRLAYAALAVELADRATADREPAPDLFRALRTALDLMQTGDPQMIALWFAAQLLVHSGYAPTTDRCQVCGRSVRSGAAFSYALGGVLCGTDQHRDPDAVIASAGALRAIGYLLHVQPEALARLVQVGGLLQGYAEYRLETKLKSPLVIQKLLKTGTPTPTTSARGGARERGNGGTRTR